MDAIFGLVCIVLGTIIFIAINEIFDIWYFGWKAMIGEWFGCCVVAAFIVNFFGGIIGGLFSVLWFLIKIVLIIALVGSVCMFIYNKIKGDKA